MPDANAPRVAKSAMFALVSLPLLAAAPASAHPHILVDARTEAAFNDRGEVVAVRHAWQFDEGFTQVALEGLDTDGNGRISEEELLPLAEVNMTALAEYRFFTSLAEGATSIGFGAPQDYWLELVGGRLTLFFSLPLAAPTSVGAGLTLTVGDPEYFVAFVFPDAGGVTLVNAPAGCAATFHPPGELDPQMAAALAAVPADERQLPAMFGAITDALSGYATIDCR